MNKPDCKHSSDHDKIAGLYNIGNTIGRGHYAVVKEAKHVFTEEKVAIKVIDKTKLDLQSREHLFSEVMCMKLVQHPNVVRLYEVIDTTNKLYLVLELGDAGDLYDYIMKYDNGLPENQAKRYFRQIVQAISYCHNLHVVHRDLKPENVVFFEKLEIVKLTDFGFSNKFTPGQTLQTSCGSLAYSAPEILLGDAYDAPKVDIWSLGVILFMLVCGRLPFNEVNDSETLSHIMDCKYDLPAKLNSSCQNLIKSMLVRIPEQRATLDQILNHDWMGPAVVDSFSVPLISQQQLTVEEHVDILTKMSEGNLATVEDIQINLDGQEYSYITATYFLLAERKLKRRQYEQFCKMKLLQIDSESECEPEIILATSSSIGDTNEERIRRFSMILEDEEVEEEEEELEAMISLASVREELTLAIPAGPDSHNIDLDVVDISSRFSRCRSAIYQSQSLSSIVDRRPNKSRHRRSLPGQSITFTSHHKRRSFPVLSYNFSPTHSNSDISDNDSMLLRGYSDKKRISVPKSLGKHFLSLSTHSKYHKPLTPDWMNSNSSIESEGSRYYYPRRLRIKSSTAATNSRPNSMGATMNLSLSSDDDDASHRQPMLSLSNSPTMGNITTLHRDICAPIHEEDELIRSRSYIDKDTNTNVDRGSNLYSFRSVSIDCRRKSESTDGTPAKWMPFAPQNRYQQIKKLQQSQKIDSRSLSSQLTQSNFSLSSFASSLRDSKAMMNVVRGAFELQCLANKMKQNNAGGGGRYVIASSSANVSGRQSRCEFASVSSLPLGHKLHSPDDPESNVLLINQCAHNDVDSSPIPYVAVVHSQESLLSNNVSIKTSPPSNNGGILIRASSTVTRKARLILSCCRPS